MIGSWISVTWPQVYPNLIASGVTAVAAWLWGRRHWRRHKQSLADLHTKVDLLLDPGKGGQRCEAEGPDQAP